MVQKITFERRFDPDGECVATALDFIGYWLNTPFSASAIKEVSNFYDITKLLRKHRLCFTFNFPKVSFLSPFVLVFSFYAMNNVSGDIKFKNLISSLKKKNQKHCICYRLTAKQLYNISENWTHMIVSYWNGNEYQIYDPLLEKLSSESRVNFLSHSDLDNMNCQKFITYN